MRLIAIWMTQVLLISTTAAAAQPPVVRRLSTAGTVWVNAAALPSGSSVYVGDTVATGESGFALITSSGAGRVEVRQDSLVSVGKEEISLQGGVVGSDGAAVRLGPYLIRPAAPANSRPWFVVASRQGRTLVAAYKGGVWINRAGTAPLLVPAGSYAVPAAAADDDKNSGNPSAGNSGPGQGGGWTIGSLNHQASVALIVSLGAMAVAGTMLGLALTNEPVSPSQ